MTLTAALQSGGLPDTGTTSDTPNSVGSRPDWCRLLECLLDRNVTGSLLDELLKRFGGDRDAFERCVRKLCEAKADREQRHQPGARTNREAIDIAEALGSRSSELVTEHEKPAEADRAAAPAPRPSSSSASSRPRLSTVRLSCTTTRASRCSVSARKTSPSSVVHPNESTRRSVTRLTVPVASTITLQTTEIRASQAAAKRKS